MGKLFVLFLLVLCSASSGKTSHRVSESVPRCKCDQVINENCFGKNKIRTKKIICVYPSLARIEEELQKAGGYNPRYASIDACGVADFKPLGDFHTAPLLHPFIASSEVTQCRRKKNMTCAFDDEKPPVPPFKIQQPTKTPKDIPLPLYVKIYGKKARNPLYQGGPWWTKGVPGKNENKAKSRVKRDPPTTSTVKPRKCLFKGEIIPGTNRYQACSVCSVKTDSGTDVYPKFVNELVCAHTLVPPVQNYVDPNCMSNLGFCIQQSLRIPGIRITGFTRKQNGLFQPNIERVQITVRAYCSCQISQVAKNITDLFLVPSQGPPYSYQGHSPGGPPPPPPPPPFYQPKIQ
ncbi:uncharacterized protein LOC116615754 isoform X3 [Nematostella vectensis]|nr:uncharacterized protein LOC116615754 isoform X3 [Nematostella vectensis]XP_048582621.1 uncharacterized protein LOC116615754 isoform X3 [Nematostella vectensis]XP_048582622.1 uncharacterized protein LOC116615754 isoform X3 [Nematostella vectensis]